MSFLWKWVKKHRKNKVKVSDLDADALGVKEIPVRKSDADVDAEDDAFVLSSLRLSLSPELSKSLSASLRHSQAVSQIQCPYEGCEEKLISERALFFHCFGEHISEPALNHRLLCPLCPSLSDPVQHFISHLNDKHREILDFMNVQPDTPTPTPTPVFTTTTTSSSSLSSSVLLSSGKAVDEPPPPPKIEEPSSSSSSSSSSSLRPLPNVLGLSKSTNHLSDVLDLSNSMSMTESQYLEYDEYSEDVVDVFEAYFDIADNPLSFMPPGLDANGLRASIDHDVAFLPPIEELEALNPLTSTQKKAVKHVVTQSKKLSDKAYPSLKSRVKGMGWEKGDLKKVMRYIRDRAPLIIHVDLSATIHFFLNDTNYRNQFETNSSRGTLSHPTRIGWENRMFNKLYDKSSGFERVKYGVLNMVNDPHGIETCVYYGDSYFELKKVRLRTSFADRDTGYDDAILASCEYYCHILSTYQDNELNNVLDVAKHIEDDPTYYKNSVENSYYYKEIQIHGEVRFDTHIKSIHINVRHQHEPSLLSQIKEFAKKNNITELVYTDGKKVE